MTPDVSSSYVTVADQGRVFIAKVIGWHQDGTRLAPVIHMPGALCAAPLSANSDEYVALTWSADRAVSAYSTESLSRTAVPDKFRKRFGRPHPTDDSCRW